MSNEHTRGLSGYMVISRLQQAKFIYSGYSRKLLSDYDMAFGALYEAFIPAGSLFVRGVPQLRCATGQRRRAFINNRAPALLLRVSSHSLVVRGHSHGLGGEMEGKYGSGSVRKVLVNRHRGTVCAVLLKRNRFTHSS